MQYKRKISIMVSFLVLSVVMIILLVAIKIIYTRTEGDTVEFAATISEVRVTDTEKGTSISLITNEYGTELLIYDDITEGLVDDISSLNTGDTIYFRVEDVWANQLDDTGIVYIMSLRTEHEAIFTLSDYNNCIYAWTNKMRTEIGIFSILCLSAAIYCGISIIIKKKKDVRQNSNQDV